MTEEHFALLLETAEASQDSEGWSAVPSERLLTLYVAAGGATLTVGRVQALERHGGLLKARTAKGEIFVLALPDVYAGALEAPPAAGRKAGFQSPA